MKLSNDDYMKIENRIKSYYQNLKAIQAKKEHRERLQSRLKKLENDRDNINIVVHLNPDLRGVIYDRVVVSGGQLPCSEMDRQIENIYLKLEKEKEQLANDILLGGIEIRQLEKANDLMEQAMSMLDLQAKEILNLRYGKRCSYEEIADKVLLSKSNTRRKINTILHDLYLLFEYIEISGTK